VLRSLLKKKGKKAGPLVDHSLDLKLVQRAHGKKIPGMRQLLHIKKILSRTEKILWNVSVLVFIVGVFWSGSVLMSTYRIQVPDVGGRFVEGVIGSPESINPLFASVNDVDTDIAQLVYSGLMRYDAKQRLVTDLAASFEISEDGKVYTLVLRDNLKWHDDEPLTANDIVFTIDTIQNPDVNSPLFFSFQGVGVEAVDEKTVQFTLEEPFGAFLSTLTVGIIPEHIWFDIDPTRMRLSQKNLQPIGSGPFAYSKFTKDEEGFILTYELVRYEGYHRQAPFLEEFAFQFYAEYEGPNGAIQAMREGAIDSLNFVPNDLREKVERKNTTLHDLQLPEYTALFFNQDRKSILADEDVRGALTYAVDKDRIVRESLDGEGQVIESFILPGFPGFNPEMEKVMYSPEEAGKLLDKEWERIPASEYRKERKDAFISEWRATSTSTDEGTAEGTEGEGGEAETIPVPPEVEEEIERLLDEELNPAQTLFRKGDNDELLELTVVTGDTTEQRHAAELIAGYWQEIGVKTNLRFVAPSDISKDVLKERSYDVLLFGVIIGSDPDQYPFWHSSQVTFPGLNLSGFADKNVDAMLEKARETVHEPTIIDLYQKIQESILSERPAVFLYTPTYTYVVGEGLQGFDVTRISHPSDRFADVFRWYTKTSGQWKWKSA